MAKTFTVRTRLVLCALSAVALLLTQASLAQAASGAAEALEKLATDGFGPLTEAEHRTVRAAPSRGISWCGPNAEFDDPANNPAAANQWGHERTIRAELLRWLSVDPQAARYVHPSGIGVAAARIEGRLDLSYLDGSRPLTLLRCAIPAGVDFSFAHLAALDFRSSVTGPLVGQSAAVRGDLTLRHGTYQGLDLFRAEVSGNLDCSAGRFFGPEATTISAVEASIGGDALFHDGFTTDGMVDFRLARIGRSLSFNDARFSGDRDNGLNGERLKVNETLYWVELKQTARTQLDLRDAVVGGLWDDPSSWPASGNLVLEGFVYSSLIGEALDSGSRLRWLALAPKGYRPQPYRQLAKVLREAGRESEATDVLVAKEDLMRRHGGLSSAERLWKLLLKVTIGYGYRPMLALWWICGFVIVGTLLFAAGYRTRIVTPTDADAYREFVESGESPPHYPPFNAFVYSLENFLPVVDLNQGTYWRPNPRHAVKGLLSDQRNASRIAAAPAKLLRWYLWLHITAGWILTPLFFAGLSGLIRAD